MTRRDDDPALGRRENNHRAYEKAQPYKSVTQKARFAQEEREKRQKAADDKRKADEAAKAKRVSDAAKARLPNRFGRGRR